MLRSTLGHELSDDACEFARRSIVPSFELAAVVIELWDALQSCGARLDATDP